MRNASSHSLNCPHLRIECLRAVLAAQGCIRESQAAHGFKLQASLTLPDTVQPLAATLFSATMTLLQSRLPAEVVRDNQDLHYLVHERS